MSANAASWSWLKNSVRVSPPTIQPTFSRLFSEPPSTGIDGPLYSTSSYVTGPFPPIGLSDPAGPPPLHGDSTLPAGSGPLVCSVWPVRTSVAETGFTTCRASPGGGGSGFVRYDGVWADAAP